MARPSVDLDWAENDVVDATSGQNNKIEPPTAWKNNGWSYQEKPPRNYDNYHKWNTGQWIKYLDQIAVRPATYFVAANDAAAETKLHADAVCDGASDQAQINAAITSVATTGGLVMLSEGTFTLSGAIVLSSNVHLCGMGDGATTLKVQNTEGSDYSVLDLDAVSDVRVYNLTVDGNSASAANNGIGIEVTSVSSTRVTICDVSVKNMNRTGSNGDGIVIADARNITLARVSVRDNDNSGIVVSGTAHSVYVSDCRVDNNGLEGIDVSATRVQIIGGRASGNGAYGIKLAATDCRVIGCEVRTNASNGIHVSEDNNLVAECLVTLNENNGVEINAADYSQVIGCQVIENDNHGIVLDANANENTVADNWVYRNSQATHATYNGIEVGTDSGSNRISDNKIRRGLSSPQQQYGIGGAGLTAGNGNYIYDNDMLGSGITGNFPGTAAGKTIPEWIGSAAGTNVQDDITKANRIT